MLYKHDMLGLLRAFLHSCTRREGVNRQQDLNGFEQLKKYLEKCIKEVKNNECCAFLHIFYAKNLSALMKVILISSWGVSRCVSWSIS